MSRNSLMTPPPALEALTLGIVRLNVPGRSAVITGYFRLRCKPLTSTPAVQLAFVSSSTTSTRSFYHQKWEFAT